MITLLSDDEFTTLKNNKKYVKELNLILANTGKKTPINLLLQ